MQKNVISINYNENNKSGPGILLLGASGFIGGAVYERLKTTYNLTCEKTSK